MAHVRESFPVLENAAGEGTVLAQVRSGDAIAGKNGALVFTHQDADGNLVAPRVSAQGALYVDTRSAGDKIWVRGAVAGGHVPADAAAPTYVEICRHELINDGDYTELSLICSSRRDAYFQLVLDDGTTQTPLADLITGPGQYTVEWYSTHFVASIPATGTYALAVRAYNFDKASQLAATFACVETA